MTDQIISREEARAQGLNRYFTGVPCKRLHIACRFVANATCCQCSQITERKRNGTTEASIERRRQASIARKCAQQRGDSRYSTGVPCKNGHLAERVVSNGQCLECARLIHLERYRDNPEHHRAIAKNHYARNKDGIRERRKAEYAADPEKHRAYVKASLERLDSQALKERRRAQYVKRRDAAREYNKKYRLENYEKLKVRQASYNQTERGKAVRQKWKEKNKEFLNQRERERRASNPELRRNSYKKWAKKEDSDAVIAANAHRRRARLLTATGRHTPDDLREILAAQAHRCPYCNADLKQVKRHVDHIMPLSRGGSNDKTNIQILCQTCNLSKGDKDPIEYERSIGLRP
jgi:5-methylcytosine-specific restriction endonuclease McrA